ncbi:hypothetical protein [Candidatus Methylomirabilis sp.]|uniref:hypothetical protein n=1 Tax=Candidatus Methylomirabilis sp. TaxID=2032687 RepID=UPI003C7239F9
MSVDHFDDARETARVFAASCPPGANLTDMECTIKVGVLVKLIQEISEWRDGTPGPFIKSFREIKQEIKNGPVA